jgi:hypothetical protein
MSEPLYSVRDEGSLRELAVRRVKDRRDFQGHLVAYLVVNAFLWGIWLLTTPGGFPWPAWVSLGWGIGVVLNWWNVTRRPMTADEVEAEMARLRHG